MELDIADIANSGDVERVLVEVDLHVRPKGCVY